MCGIKLVLEIKINIYLQCYTQCGIITGNGTSNIHLKKNWKQNNGTNFHWLINRTQNFVFPKKVLNITEVGHTKYL